MTPTRVVALAIVLVAASTLGWRLGQARHAEAVGVVTAVVDGDTVEVALAGGVTVVRLLGVDTPETVAPGEPVGCFGPEAAAFTERALSGRRVRLEFDAVRHDAYGRTLAFVSVDGDRFNDRLLREGFARLLVIPPNGRHGRALLGAELDARRDGRGLWAHCAENT